VFTQPADGTNADGVRHFQLFSQGKRSDTHLAGAIHAADHRQQHADVTVLKVTPGESCEKALQVLSLMHHHETIRFIEIA
jgi:ribosomal protein L19